jgi:4-hydroxyphenylacetate 3-monooxygenase
VMTPAAMPLWTVRMMFPRMFVRMCEIIQLLGAGGLVAVPSYAELAGPAAADVTTYFQAANADAATRIKLFRLAFDAAVSSFSGRQQLYERYYSGDPVRLAGTLYSLYGKDTSTDRIFGMLDDLEARQRNRPGDAG